MKHRGLPQGMTYAQKLAHDRAIAAGIKQAAIFVSMDLLCTVAPAQRAMRHIQCTSARWVLLS